MVPMYMQSSLTRWCVTSGRVAAIYKFHERAARRVKKDMAAGKSPRSYKFHRRLMDAIEGGAVVSHAIVQDQMDDLSAFELEAATIAGYPAGQLWNEAPGGIGFDINEQGLDMLRQKHHEAVQRRWADPSSREVASKAATSRWTDEEARERHRDILRKSWQNEELRTRHREGFQKRFASKEAMMEYQRWVATKRAEKYQARRERNTAALTNALISFGC